eukprot:403369133
MDGTIEDDDEDMSDSDDEGGSITQSGQKSKHKRRSKNDNQGRNFRCGCGKKYLSYPALYTHIKTKHNGVTPTGTNTSQFQTGRGRGRPRKIQTLVQDKEEQLKVQQQNQLINPSMKQMGLLSYLESHLTDEKLQREKDFLTCLNCVGGPTNPLEWFYERTDSSNSSDDDQLYNLVHDHNLLIQQSLRQLNIEAMKANVYKGTLYLANLTDEERGQLKIDQILAIFLIDMSEQVIVNFYKAVTVFVTLYRNCLNEIGWDQIANYKRLDLIESINQNEDSIIDSGLPIFTQVKDGDFIPQLSNEFILEYLPQKCNIFYRKLAVSLVEHLCRWLYNRKLTQLKISQNY